MSSRVTSLTDWLAARVSASPEALAMIMANRRWTYAELHAQVDLAARYLAGRGIGPGSRVAILSPNSPDYVILIHALARLGAVLVPLNVRQTPDELGWQLAQARCGWLCHDEGFTDIARDSSGDRVSLFSLGEWSHVPGPTRFPGFPEGTHATDAMENVQAIVFTSGTTGRPKGACLTFANHFWSATASAFRLGLSTQDTWLNCLPLYHVGGLAIVLRSCLYGTVMVLHQGFDAEAVNQALDQHDVTLISLVPTMLHRLIEERGDNPWPASLRLVLLGGAAAPPELVARCQELAIPLATTYGLTEAASQVATMRPGDVFAKPGSVGKPLMFTRVRIADGDGQDVPTGVPGEIVVAGETVMKGYDHDDEATARSLRGGELFTGDIGYLDANGDLWLLQRRDDIIISGGENVYPAEVETILRGHPSVMAACVVGVSDAEWGQRVAALIVRKPDSSVTESDLERYCRGKLAGYKLPRTIRFVADLPQTASGKIHRQAAADMLSGLAVG